MNTNNRRGLRFAETEEKDKQALKKALRIRARNVRSGLVNRDVKESLIRENTLALLREIQKRKGAGTRLKVFVYLSYSSETPTDGLIQALLEKGVEVYCPRLENGEMTAVKFTEAFTLSPLGIREPIGAPYDGQTDVAITPLLAADRLGNRLGYGGGYYDRYFQAHAETLRVGYCFDAQLFEKIPAESWDKPLQYIVTEKEIIYVK